jgi:hypothetical protein
MIIFATIAALFLSVSPEHISGNTLDDALDLAPESARVVAVVADLRRANDDLGQMIDAMGRPGTVLAGRPIEMVKAQFGIGAGLDERGAAVMYLGESEAEAGEPEAVFLVPTTDPGSFIDSNFPDRDEVVPGISRVPGEQPLFVRPLEKHVLISNSQKMAEAHAPAGSLSGEFKAAFDPRVIDRAVKADILLWTRGDAIKGLFGNAGDRVPINAPFLDDSELIDALTTGLEESVVLFDFDPLGISIRTFARYEADSSMNGLLQGGKGSGAPMSRLPGNPYYFALSADLGGLGGFDTFRNILGLLDISLADYPEDLREGRLGLRQIQFAAYPSRLGIALGGLFNDSSLVVTAERPEALEAVFRTTLLSMQGDRGGIRYEPEWTDDKPLRTGGVSDAFRLKETVLPPSKSSSNNIVRNSAFQRIALQLLYGSRGLSGFAGVRGDALVMTLSQRPDVWNRALAAAGEDGGTIGDSPVLKSMRSWLIEKPDLELLIGMGSLTKLMQQLSRAIQIGIFDPDMIPEIPQNTPPVVFDLSIDGGLLETATVLPTAVIALGYDQILRQLTEGFMAPGVDP